MPLGEPREGSRESLPRWSLALIAGLLAPIFGWAAWALPWASWSFFAVLNGLLAVAHLAVAVMAALRARRLRIAWRVQSVLGLAYLAYVGWGLLSSAWYVRAIYAGLGDGVAAALVAVFGLVAVLVLPLAIWGLIATGGVRLGKMGWGALVVVVVLAALRLRAIEQATRGVMLAGDEQIAAFAAGIGRIDFAALPPLRRPKGARAIVARCAAPPGAATLTAIVAYAGKRGQPTVRCLQAPQAQALADAVGALLAREARRAPVKIDLVTEKLPLDADIALVQSLALRPGLDGACHGGHCLAPWQLVVLEAFTHHAPLPSVPDARLGAAIDELVRLLGGPIDRIATRGWQLTSQGLVEVGRTAPPIAVTAENVDRATAAAWRYVQKSQRGGRFRYLVDPFSGRTVSEDRSIARQAGTTLAICELAPDDAVARRTARRSLDHLAKLERRYAGGEAAVLRDDPRSPLPEERVGPSALALAAFLRCRPRVGDRYDGLVARLGRTLRLVQRDDGGFHHRIDVEAGQPVPGRGSIFVDGQIVLALTLLEARDPSLFEPVERAMAYFGGPYWDGFLRPLLFLEENWHCIAAAAAIPIHRHDGYERFCIDYVTMKGRIIHEGDDVHPDFLGGYGFGNLVPPHNTATAGYGEALAAAVVVMKARGDDTAVHEERLRRVMGFLLRNQHLDHCPACAPAAIGSFSEHMASPLVRIDYVQHAWAALGHGGEALGI